jgi:rRNA maturation protein Nop10
MVRTLRYEIRLNYDTVICQSVSCVAIRSCITCKMKTVGYQTLCTTQYSNTMRFWKLAGRCCYDDDELSLICTLKVCEGDVTVLKPARYSVWQPQHLYKKYRSGRRKVFLAASISIDRVIRKARYLPRKMLREWNENGWIARMSCLYVHNSEGKVTRAESSLECWTDTSCCFVSNSRNVKKENIQIQCMSN